MTTTTPTFNLVDQPWIPCVWLDGRRESLRLEAVLTHAHELREIYDDSPLVTVSLHRLLLAIVHHALRGPPGIATNNHSLTIANSRDTSISSLGRVAA